MDLSFFKVALCALAGAFPLFSAVAAAPEVPFRIAVIRETRSQDLIKVGKEWRKDLPRRIQVSLRVNEDMPSRGVTVKAYFYDENQKLVFTVNQPNPVWTQTPRGIGEVLLPDELKRNKTFEVYFALPEKVTEAKWKSMVVVFGKGNALVAQSRPASVLEKVEFPEKALIAAETK